MTVRRALAYSYIEKYGSFLLGLVSTALISRVLTPADIGVFAIGMSVVSIVAVVREFGVSTYLVQERDLTEERIRAAFTVTVMMGVGLCLIVLLMSIPAGRFYEDSRVTVIVAVLAANFAITPLGSVSQSLLMRDLQFGTVTWIRLLQSTTLSIASVAFAELGWGPLSLAWAAVVANSINSAVSIKTFPHAMRLTLSKTELRRVLAVGGPATAISVVDEVVTSLPELVLGRTQGFAAAGLFSRARGMSQMAHQLLARAAGPVFLAVFADRQRSGVRLAPLYARANACVVGIGWAALAMLIVLAEPIVRLLFGDAWLAVVPMMRWLSLAAALALPTSGAHHLLLADGGARDVLNAKLAALPAQVGVLAVGALYGIEWMSIATILSSGVASFILGLAVRRRFGISITEQFHAVFSSTPLMLAAAAGASVGLLLSAPPTWIGALERLALGASAGLVLAGIVLTLGRHPLRQEATIVLVRLRHVRSSNA